MPFLAALVILIVIILLSCINVVPQARAYVIERLGGYQGTWGVGIHFKIPFIDRVARKVDLKEQVADFPPQPVITKDNVTMRIDTVIFYQIINAKMRSSLDTATDPWGIKVNRVELKNIIPPAAIQDAMEKQMKAEREKREAILRSQGEKESAILVAEGKKQSAILDAEAEKQAAILRAEAKKEATIREAEGQAQAILAVQQANADGIKMLNDAAASDNVIKLKSLDAFAKAADGKATKIIIPSEIQGLAGLAKSVTEIAKEN